MLLLRGFSDPASRGQQPNTALGAREPLLGLEERDPKSARDEAIGDSWIKLAATTPNDFRAYLRLSQRLTVWPFAGHRIDRVSE